MKKIFEIVQGLFSLDEEKSSIVVYIMIAVATIGLIKTYHTGDFPNNLMVLLQFLVGSTMAYNVTNNITTKVNDAKVKKAEIESGTVISNAVEEVSTEGLEEIIEEPFIEELEAIVPEVPADFVPEESSEGKLAP